MDKWKRSMLNLMGMIQVKKKRENRSHRRLLPIKEMLKEQEHRCALTGRALTPDDCWIDFRNPSLDENKYSRENVQLVVGDVCRAKRLMSEGEFIELCKDVLARRSKRNTGPSMGARL